MRGRKGKIGVDRREMRGRKGKIGADRREMRFIMMLVPNRFLTYISIVHVCFLALWRYKYQW